MASNEAAWKTWALVIAALIGTGVVLWIHHDSRSTSIYARVVNPSPGLTVELDDPTNRRPVNEYTGYFRFDDVGIGRRELTFLHPIFDSHVRAVEISRTGTHELLPDIVLPNSTDEKLRKGKTLYAFALDHSDDASEPIRPDLPPDPMIVPPVERPRVWAHAAYEEPKRVRGWAYLGKGNVQETMSELGGTKTLDMTAVLRKAPPTKDLNAEGYSLGEKVGKIEAGESVYVETYVQVGDSVWAVVRPVKPESKRNKFVPE